MTSESLLRAQDESLGRIVIARGEDTFGRLAVEYKEERERSGSSPFVAVVKSTDLREFYDSA